MEYITAADTDIGISKKTNQDSLCIKVAEAESGMVGLMLVCDGMGGLDMGELASATVIRSFVHWFDNELPFELSSWDWHKVAKRVTSRIQSLNAQLIDYGRQHSIQLGTTATGVIALGSKYLSFHVGDTRLYKISYQLRQLTEDQTFINREIKRGSMTPEQAATDPRRNALIQCIGVSGAVTPEIQLGTLEDGANYLICSDGFRHVVSEEEIFEALSPRFVTTRSTMQAKMRGLIDTVKERGERDNISALMFRPEMREV
ncbi:MAG: serine/threonine-protein phosphatase [Ruminococcus sp.]|nr:serine/threonine-protein phosphatase [Ruminococcus sp.]